MANKKVTTQQFLDEQGITNKIVIAEGTDHEYTKYLEPPKGKKARKIMPDLLEFMNVINAAQEKSQGEFSSITHLISTMWSMNDFEERLVPFALQMTTPKELQMLDEEFTLVELMEAFMVAAQYNIFASLSKPEVEVALKKSRAAAPAASEQETQK